jgi:solute carrier family 25 2-oxodicarboxylate transporter 21
LLTFICRQLQQGKGAGAEGYNGMVDCFRKIVKNEGFSRLYRGITAPILMEAPKRYLLWFQEIQGFG